MAPISDEPRKPLRFYGAIAINFGLLLLYLLSVGPAQVLFNRGHLSDRTFSAIYAPLFWLCDQSDVIYDAFVWYIEWWDTV